MNFLKICAFVLFGLFSTPVASQSLVLITDVSESMLSDEQDLQFQAYEKLLSENFYDALQGRHVEVVLFGRDVASASSGSVDDAIAAFKLLSNIRTRGPFIQKVFNRGPRDTTWGGATCISLALAHVYRLDLPEPIIIDISGDGEENCYVTQYQIPDLVQKFEDRGIYINSLPMNSAEVAAWYNANVTSGFQIPADNINQFEESLYLKLMAEVAMLE